MSDWKARAVRRRDARHTKSPNETPPAAAANRSKNTKRWCRGKVGVEHKPKCVDFQSVKYASYRGDLLPGWKLLICTECGKNLAYYSPPWPGSSRPPKPKPEWVV